MRARCHSRPELRPWARAALRYGVTALAILLFVLALRRAGKRAGRLCERLEAMEKTHYVQTRTLEAAVRRRRSRGDLASGCATIGSEPGIVTVCPHLVEVSRELLARVAEELALLPEGSVITELLSDFYAVMRAQLQGEP